MDAHDYEKLWGELTVERGALISERTDLENALVEVRSKLSHLEEILNRLGPLANITGEIVGLGITDAIRFIVQNATERLSAQDIRQQLVDQGYDLNPLTAPMASIYKVLSRLADDSKEIEREKEGSKVFYKWKTESSSPISDEDIPF